MSTNIWAGLIVWAVTTLPVIAWHHLAIRRYIRRVTNRQTTAILNGGGDERNTGGAGDQP